MLSMSLYFLSASFCYIPVTPIVFLSTYYILYNKVIKHIMIIVISNLHFLLTNIPAKTIRTVTIVTIVEKDTIVEAIN